MAPRTFRRIGVASPATARQAAYGMPSGPAQELFDDAMAYMRSSLLGSKTRSGSMTLSYGLRKVASPSATGRAAQILDQKALAISALASGSVTAGASGSSWRDG